MKSTSAAKKTQRKAPEAATAPVSVWDKEAVLYDYRISYESRQASLLGRREVLSGKAKFGIFGDGKEVPQMAMARAFRKGDFRSGYYRDQTVMFALGISSVREFFAQLYANTDVAAEPASAGRMMNGHFATRSLNDDGTWKNLMQMYNSSADVSPTASQMPRLVGLGYASKVYRSVPELSSFTMFSEGGNEVAFGTIGNASAAEGLFWESVNAIGVLGAPVVLSIWDDGYGISVENRFQMTKDNIGEILSGYQRAEGTTDGYDIYVVKGWDYPALVEAYRKATEIARLHHVPAIIHVTEVTQPQGHSTSGSHERYKSKERLAWEEEFDCIRKMREWILTEKIATEEELATLEETARSFVIAEKEAAWKAYLTPIAAERDHVVGMFEALAGVSAANEAIRKQIAALRSLREPFRRDIFEAIHHVLLATRNELHLPQRSAIITWRNAEDTINKERYGSHLYSQSAEAALRVKEIPAHFTDSSPTVVGFEVLNACFDALLARDPRVLAFGEDVGKLGDVNQGFSGLQAKYGEVRVADRGIREATILGEAIGMAMRGLRPIAEIQYLDYLLYALQLLSDDLATVLYRTKGGQKAPVIVRTRGHRLEGVWHSGSPMAGIINLVRGVYVLVPRNMTQAAGFYNTMMQSDDTAIIVEVLNGYRLKERLPDNIGSFTIPLGVPEILRSGTDITVVTYGACCRLAEVAAQQLEDLGISVELIDARSLLPFDTVGMIGQSLRKTNRILFLDEDVPGGTTAYMMREVLEVQGGYRYLDSAPATLAAAEHRPPYGSDGNYWAKPEVEHIVRACYNIMHEAKPARYPVIF